MGVGQDAPHRWVLTTVLLSIVGLIVFGTVASMVSLWPDSTRPTAASSQSELAGADGESVAARITQLTEVPCDAEPSASSIYTLVFAYAGAMLVVLLLLYTYPSVLIVLATTEQIGQEVTRTLIGASGLVLSMPVTTLFAVLFVPPPSSSESSEPSRVPRGAERYTCQGDTTA